MPKQPPSSTVIEPLLRMAISGIEQAQGRIEVVEQEAENTSQKYATRLPGAVNHLQTAIDHIRYWASTNGIQLRNTMKT